VIELLGLCIFCGLSAWRVASLLHTEDAFEWLRGRLGIGHDQDGIPVVYPETLAGRVFRCFWCLTLIVAIPLAMVIGWTSDLALWEGVLLALGSSAVAIWLERQVMRSQAR